MEISLAAEPLFHIGSFAVTNTLVMSWFVMATLIGASLVLSRRITTVPTGFQNVVEAVIEKLLFLMDSVTGKREESKKFFPLVATIFLFVVFSNWIELVPGLGTIGLRETHDGKTVLIPFIRSASADLNVTLALALISVFSVQFFGIASLGLFRHVKKFINVSGPINFFVGILELISEISKMISFSFRLFGNIFAGEVLLLVMLVLVPYLVPLPFLALELFVGFIQALVFSMLTLVFLKMATVEAH
jgi:F-type H+-transporting ATPase subunit a